MTSIKGFKLQMADTGPAGALANAVELATTPKQWNLLPNRPKRNR